MLCTTAHDNYFLDDLIFEMKSYVPDALTELGIPRAFRSPIQAHYCRSKKHVQRFLLSSSAIRIKTQRCRQTCNTKKTTKTQPVNFLRHSLGGIFSPAAGRADVSPPNQFLLAPPPSPSPPALCDAVAAALSCRGDAGTGYFGKVGVNEEEGGWLGRVREGVRSMVKTGLSSGSSSH